MKNNTLIISIVVIVVVLLVGVGIWLANGNNGAFGLSNDVNGMSASSTNAASTSTMASKGTTTTTVTKTTGTAQPGVSTSGGTHNTTASQPGGIPYISSVEPASASTGSTVTIYGTNFSKTKNAISFGTSSGLHHADGTPDNVFATVASTDGKTLTFTIPSAGPSGVLCDAQGSCRGVSAIRITPGSYPIMVTTSAGPSNIVRYTVSA